MICLHLVKKTQPVEREKDEDIDDDVDNVKKDDDDRDDDDDNGDDDDDGRFDKDRRATNLQYESEMRSLMTPKSEVEGDDDKKDCHDD